MRILIHRLRRRYGELLREEVARTVSASEEVEEELAAILDAKTRPRVLRESCPSAENLL